MSQLFESFQLKNITLKNRILRSATTSYWSDDQGILRDVILDYYRELAQNELGLIIKGHSYVHEDGKAHNGQSGLTNEKHLPQMAKLTSLVHSYDVPIIAQLNHAGYSSIGRKITASHYRRETFEAKEASIDEIKSIIESFANAAELAIQAGFDGVQIHAAHGYLISQFLSDRINKRKDQYGGNLENRARFLIEVFKTIQKKIGSKPIIGMKINCDDFALEGGLQIEDSIQVNQILVAKGIDFIEISGGGPEQNRDVRKIRAKPDENAPYYEANFSGHMEKIRKAIPNFPFALVNGIRSRKVMDAILENDLADLISMSKPFIREPDFIRKLKTEQKRSECIDCNKCVSNERFGTRMLSCAQKEQ
ncbi:MAG: hypothetical protein ACFFDW_02725 [Candidatus Thorarchaeota archaeon]